MSEESSWKSPKFFLTGHGTAYSAALILLNCKNANEYKVYCKEACNKQYKQYFLTHNVYSLIEN